MQAAPPNFKHRVTIWHSNATPGSITQEKWNIHPDKILYPNSHRGIIHNNQNMERTQVSINWWMDDYNIRCPYNGYPPAIKGTVVLTHVVTGWAWITQCSVEGARHKGHIVYKAFMFSVQSRQIYKDRKWIGGCLRLGWGGWRNTEGAANGYRVSFGGSDEKVPKLTVGIICTTQ